MRLGLACPACGRYNVRPDRRAEYVFNDEQAVRLYVCQDCRRRFLVRFQVVTELVAMELEDLLNGVQD